MASIQQDSRTGNLTVCFIVRRGPVMRRFNLSLGTKDRSLGTGKRSFAQDLATDLEDAAHGGIGRSSIEERLNKIADQRLRDKAEALFRRSLEAGLGKTLDADTVEGAIKRWLGRQETQVRSTTLAAYQTATARLVEFMDFRRTMPLSKVTREMLEDFHRSLAKTSSATTAYHKVKILRIFFKDAQGRYGLAANPAAGIKKSKEDEQRPSRRPFTLQQLKAIEKQCAGEWRGLFLFGLFTGQRLSDIATLKWHNLRFDGPEATWCLRFVSRKTRRQMDVPLAAQPLRDYILDELTTTDDEDAYVFPQAAAAVAAAKGRAGTLSNGFRRILKNAGILGSMPEQNPKNPKGRRAKREASIYSFHSLRHTTVSLLKNAGISPEIVMDIIGHESTAISNTYTHISHEAKVAALEMMPVLGSKKDKGPRKWRRKPKSS